MGDDTGGTRHPSLSIGKKNGVWETDFVSSYLVTTSRAFDPLCLGKGGILCLYTWLLGERDYGAGTGKYINWVTAMAGTPTHPSLEILASPPTLKLRRVNAMNDLPTVDD